MKVSLTLSQTQRNDSFFKKVQDFRIPCIYLGKPSDRYMMNVYKHKKITPLSDCGAPIPGYKQTVRLVSMRARCFRYFRKPV